MPRRDQDIEAAPGDPSGLPRLGELESRVLEILWKAGGWPNTREVLDVLAVRRNVGAAA